MNVDTGADGGFDSGASMVPTTTNACSCDVAANSDGHIHVCTGSYEQSVCRQLTCEESNVRPQRCPEKDITLCCALDGRGLYSQLYNDCTHPNCESGFRAECEDLGGSISAGACESPALPDDPDTETSDATGSCAIGYTTPAKRNGIFGWLVSLALVVRRRRAGRP